MVDSALLTTIKFVEITIDFSKTNEVSQHFLIMGNLGRLVSIEEAKKTLT